jgi:hypothetical protein
MGLAFSHVATTARILGTLLLTVVGGWFAFIFLEYGALGVRGHSEPSQVDVRDACGLDTALDWISVGGCCFPCLGKTICVQELAATQGRGGREVAIGARGQTIGFNETGRQALQRLPGTAPQLHSEMMIEALCVPSLTSLHRTGRFGKKRALLLVFFPRWDNRVQLAFARGSILSFVAISAREVFNLATSASISALTCSTFASPVVFRS